MKAHFLFTTKKMSTYHWIVVVDVSYPPEKISTRTFGSLSSAKWAAEFVSFSLSSSQASMKSRGWPVSRVATCSCTIPAKKSFPTWKLSCTTRRLRMGTCRKKGKILSRCELITCFTPFVRVSLMKRNPSSPTLKTRNVWAPVKINQSKNQSIGTLFEGAAQCDGRSDIRGRVGHCISRIEGWTVLLAKLFIQVLTFLKNDTGIRIFFRIFRIFSDFFLDFFRIFLDFFRIFQNFFWIFFGFFRIFFGFFRIFFWIFFGFFRIFSSVLQSLLSFCTVRTVVVSIPYCGCQRLTSRMMDSMFLCSRPKLRRLAAVNFRTLRADSSTPPARIPASATWSCRHSTRRKWNILIQLPTVLHWIINTLNEAIPWRVMDSFTWILVGRIVSHPKIRRPTSKLPRMIQ